jgi:dihydrofolate reductase
MARLLYSVIASLDGYIEDENGTFDWAEPSTEVHAFVNEQMRSIGTHLYGRGMYDVMRYWENPPDPDAQPAVEREFAEVWQEADKVVYSRTLEAPSTRRTRIERGFDADGVRALKTGAQRDLLIGGPGLASAAFAAGLVDEVRLFLVPVLVGGGKPALPDDVRLELALDDVRRFDNGTVYVSYSRRPPATNPLS